MEGTAGRSCADTVERTAGTRMRLVAWSELSASQIRLRHWLCSALTGLLHSKTTISAPHQRRLDYTDDPSSLAVSQVIKGGIKTIKLPEASDLQAYAVCFKPEVRFTSMFAVHIRTINLSSDRCRVSWAFHATSCLQHETRVFCENTLTPPPFFSGVRSLLIETSSPLMGRINIHKAVWTEKASIRVIFL